MKVISIIERLRMVIMPVLDQSQFPGELRPTGSQMYGDYAPMALPGFVDLDHQVDMNHDLDILVALDMRKIDLGLSPSAHLRGLLGILEDDDANDYHNNVGRVVVPAMHKLGDWVVPLKLDLILTNSEQYTNWSYACDEMTSLRAYSHLPHLWTNPATRWEVHEALIKRAAHLHLA